MSNHLQDGATSAEDLALKALSVGSSVKTFADRVKESPSKIPTGIDELDSVLGGGLPNNSLTVLIAAPNVGKSTLAIQTAKNIAARGIVGVYITNDMSPLALHAKVYSSISYGIAGEKGYTLGDLLGKNVLEKPTALSKMVIAEAEQTMKYLHIRDYIYDEEFDAYCKDIKGMERLSKLEKIFTVYCNTYKNVIFILDSLQQIATTEGAGKEGVDKLLLTLKTLCRTFDVPIVLISTLSRTGYSREKGGVVISDIKESGNVEYDADSIIALYPAFQIEEKTKTTMSDFKEQEYREIVIECLKSRDSGGKREKVLLYAPGCTFISVDEKPDKDEKPLKIKRPSVPKGKSKTPSVDLSDFDFGDLGVLN